MILTQTAKRSAIGLLAIVACAGMALGQSSPDVPAPPKPPRSPRAAQPAPSAAPLSTSRSWSTGSWSITSRDNDRTIKLQSSGGAVSAEIDGQAVPADRVSFKNGRVTIKDENGDVTFEMDAPNVDTSSRVYSFSGVAPGAVAITPNTPFGVAQAGPGVTGQSFAVQIAPPAVMIGVQLVEPDSSIRGHLGLSENETTMISAVYEDLPAHKAGLEPYDIIVSINGKSPAPPPEVRKALREIEAGKSISLEVLHRGQKKSVSITPEKYDEKRLEGAKVNQIAAATDARAPAAIAGIGGSPDEVAEAWARVAGKWQGQPFVATIPGQPGTPGRNITLWRSHDPQELTKRLEEIAAEAEKDAKRAQEQAKAAREQTEKMLRGNKYPVSPNPAATPEELQRMLEEHMKEMDKRMEEMMRRFMRESQDKPADEPKADPKS